MEAAGPLTSAPGTRALAWAAHPGPGPEGGGPEPGAAGGGAEARLEARPSWEVRMLRTGAKGGFGGSQAGGSSTPPHQPSRRVARRGSVVSPHTVGTELERGPGSAGAAAVAVGLELARAGRGRVCGELRRRAPLQPHWRRRAGQGARAERGDAEDAPGGRRLSSRAARACASSYSFNKHLWSSCYVNVHCMPTVCQAQC